MAAFQASTRCRPSLVSSTNRGWCVSSNSLNQYGKIKQLNAFIIDLAFNWVDICVALIEKVVESCCGKTSEQDLDTYGKFQQWMNGLSQYPFYINIYRNI